MRLVFTIVGFISGLAIAASSLELLGAVLGGLVVWALFTLYSLKREVGELHADILRRSLEASAKGSLAAANAAPDAHQDHAQDSGSAAETQHPAHQSPDPQQAKEPATDTDQPAPEEDPWLSKPARAEPDRPPEQTKPAAPQPPAPDPLADPWGPQGPASQPQTRQAAPGPASRARPAPERDAESAPLGGWLRRIGTWISSGNVPVKVGVIVSFFGVAFFLKYAIDQQLFQFPVWMRLISVAAFGLVLLGIGWRVRRNNPVYGLSLQGGGIGVLYLVVYSAMYYFGLLPPLTAFALLVVITIAAGVLAVLQDARALAVLGVVGGFLAPVLVSSGAGNHVLLFSYYLVLNAAIVGIAWFRSWRELNLIGFVFTFVIGGLWGHQRYAPDLFATTEPFLIAHFGFYHLVGLLFALKQPGSRRGLIDGTLVFGTPIVAFALQAEVVAHIEYGLAISAGALAILYAATAWLVRQQHDGQLSLLVRAYQALALAFATLSVPLALDPRWTSAVWALEGAALIWIGGLQQRAPLRLFGFALLIAAGISFAQDGWMQQAGMPILNANYLGGLLIAVASLIAARRLPSASGAWPQLFAMLSGIAFFWGLAWLVGSGFMEIVDRSSAQAQAAFLALYFAACAVAMLLVGRLLRWQLPQQSSLGLPYALLLPVIVALLENEHFLAHWGQLAWPLVILAQFGIARFSDPQRRASLPIYHYLAALLVALIAMWETAYQVHHALQTIPQALPAEPLWVSLAACLPAVLLVAAVFVLHRLRTWPAGEFPATYSSLAGTLVVMVLLIIGVLNLDNSGDASPLPYLPLINPLDLATIGIVLLSLRWLGHHRQVTGWPDATATRLCYGMLGLAALGASTMAVVRGVHHLTEVAWNADVLLQSVEVQAALSIFWSVTGLTAMVWGARTQRRGRWLVGAGLMTLVVIKLFTVDLGNSGTIERIISFTGTGVVLLVVGYLAPAPPRQTDDGKSVTARDSAK